MTKRRFIRKPHKGRAHPLILDATFDGRRWTLSYVDGSVVTLPEEIEYFPPPADFADHTRTLVKSIFQDYGSTPLGMHLGTKNHMSYKLLTAIDDNRIAWAAHASGDALWPMAASGYFWVKEFQSVPYLAAAEAETSPEHRRQGIYTAVLKHLKTSFRIDILSDSVLSPEAILMWLRHGTFDKNRKRYRFNPARSGRKTGRTSVIPFPNMAIQGALDLAYCEAVMGDRII